MRIPSKITPDCILESISELRFTSKIPEEAVFGSIYGHFKNRFTNFENLQTLQIPEQIRKSDSNLIYAPLYKLNFDDIFIQIGPRSLSFHSTDKYIGWTAFSNRIHELISEILKLDIIENVQRVGIRYINYFETKTILKDSNLSLNFNKFSLQPTAHSIILNYSKQDIGLTLRIYENANVSINKKGSFDNKVGSVIDIDSFINNPNLTMNDANKLMGLLTRTHEAEKELFFSLLSDNFIKQHNPEYQD